MGDSRHSSMHSRHGGGQSSVDLSSLMTVNGAALRNSGVLSPLVWQTSGAAASTSFTMLGLNRRDGMSTSSLAPCGTPSNGGHQRKQGRGVEHGCVPTPTPSSSSSSPANEAAVTAGWPFLVGAQSLGASAERAALITRLSGFYDFAVRLPGFHTEDRTGSPAVRSRGVEGDAEQRSHQLTEKLQSLEPTGISTPVLQTPRYSQRPEILFPIPSGAPRQRTAVHSPKSNDASVSPEVVNASAVSVPPEASRGRNNNADNAEGNDNDEESVEDRPSMAPAAGPRRRKSTSRCLSQTTDTEAPPGVTAAFHQYLMQTRQMILCADSSEADRALALDELLMRCRELFDLLRDMYALAHVPPVSADRKHLSMVKVLPYDEVSTPSSSPASSTSSFRPGGAMRTREGTGSTKGALLSCTTRTWNSQLTPFSERVLTAAAATRSKDTFERGRRTSVSSCSSSVACIEVLNNYYVTRLIGTGATGRVYLAVDKHTSKTFAMKTVPRHSRKVGGRRFPLPSMSASESEALQLEGPPPRAVHINGTAAHASGSTTNNTSLALIRPFSLGVTSARSVERREDTRDSMNVSLCEAALESLIHVAAASHPSDAAIPFVESVTASSSAMMRASGEVEAPNTSNRTSPQTGCSKPLNGSVSPSCTGGAGLHRTVVRSTNTGESVGGDSATKSVKSAYLSELPAVEREIRVMRRVRNHPHVVQLKEVIDDDKDDAVHLVMTYAENGPLTVMHGFDAARGCALCDVVRPLSRCARLLHQLAEALIYVHRQRIVHNDVKPDNILLTDADNILLTDFGESVLIFKKLPQTPAAYMSAGAAGGEGLNASVLVPHNRWKSTRGANDSWATFIVDRSPCSSSPAGQTSNTSQMMTETSFLPDSSMFLAAGVDVEGRLKGDRSAIGTPAFAAPELIMSSTCSCDSDTWSFGVVLYCVIFGRLPFAAATVSETFNKILYSPLSFPAFEEVPERAGMTETAYHQWVQLCRKLLVREPRQRLPLSAVLHHPLFRAAAAADVKSSTPATSGKEMPRNRRSSRKAHSDLSSALPLWRSIRSSQASRPMPDTEGSPLVSRVVCTNVPPSTSREATACGNAAAHNPRRSKEGSASPPLTRDSVPRNAVFGFHRLQAVSGNSQTSSIFANSATSTVSLSPPTATTCFTCRSKLTVAGDAVPQMCLEAQPLQVTCLQCQCFSPNPSPGVRHCLSGASSAHTDSFTAPERVGRLREHTLVYKPGFTSQNVSAIGSPTHQSFSSPSTPLKESPPDRVVTAGIQLTSCTDFTSPLPCPLTRAGSSTPEVGTGHHEEDQPDPSGKEGPSSSNASGVPTAVAVVAAPASPISPPTTSLAGPPHFVSASRGEREDTAAVGPYAHRWRSKGQPCERDGNSCAGCNSSYRDSSSDVAEGGRSEGEGWKQEIKDNALRLPKPPLQPPNKRSARSSSDVRPRASLHEVVPRLGKPKGGRCRQMKSVVGVPYSDSAMALGSLEKLSTARGVVQRARAVQSVAQKRASKSSLLPKNLTMDSVGSGRSSSPCRPPLQSTCDIPPKQAKKSQLWCHR
ncbi:protein kinase-like protein [Leishmania tarentolae]|uniref:Protein kinase-like protein n=1 Tax=Leishmania tarentolae TaxID=5689 RepID=A0A640KRY5_LEITA|nr:protein kinase-like protein [Leishmania tarentolae]